MQESYWNGLGSFIWDLLAMLLGMVKEYDSSMRYGARLTLLKKLFPVLHLIAIETGLQYTLAKDHLMKDL